MKVPINPSRILKMLAMVVILLTIASLSGQIYKHYFGTHRYLVSFFDLDMEWNLPTWFSSMSLFFSSLLLALIALAKKQRNDRFFAHWACLSMAFLFLSIDEAIQLHEQTIEPLRTMLNADGMFYFTWVILAGMVLLVFGLAYIRFLADLPRFFRNLIILSGALYVGGALGMEVVGGHFASTSGQENMIYVLVTTIEEVLEMTGVMVLIYTLLSYIQFEFNGLQIESDEEAAELPGRFSEVYEYNG